MRFYSSHEGGARMRRRVCKEQKELLFHHLWDLEKTKEGREQWEKKQTVTTTKARKCAGKKSVVKLVRIATGVREGDDLSSRGKGKRVGHGD